MGFKSNFFLGTKRNAYPLGNAFQRTLQTLSSGYSDLANLNFPRKRRNGRPLWGSYIHYLIIIVYIIRGYNLSRRGLAVAYLVEKAMREPEAEISGMLEPTSFHFHKHE